MVTDTIGTATSKGIPLTRHRRPEEAAHSGGTHMVALNITRGLGTEMQTNEP